MMYEHYVQFIPKGVNPNKTSTIRTVNFQKNTLDKNNIEKTAYYEADKQNIIDEYALRKHWDVFNMEINYYDEPWEGWSDLCRKFFTFKEVKSMKHVDNRIYLFLYENHSEQKLCNKIEDYYHGFSPVVHSPHIVRIDSEPEYI